MEFAFGTFGDFGWIWGYILMDHFPLLIVDFYDDSMVDDIYLSMMDGHGSWTYSFLMLLSCIFLIDHSLDI
jgi:hypothetical protein